MAQIISKFLTKNPYFNDGKWITGGNLKGFMLHSVGCNQPDPLVFIKNWDRADFTYAGISGFIGDEAVYVTASCLDTPGGVKRMPHGGKSATNNHYIGFEMCEPNQLRYTGVGANFECNDRVTAQAYVRKTYANAVDLFAKLCKLHGKDPLADGVIISHAEGSKRGIASNHADPEHLWDGLDLPFTMNGFRKDVYNKLHNIGEDEIDMTKAELEKLIDERVKAILKGEGTLPSTWAKKELQAAKENGITDASRPQGYATRQEVACMVWRSVNNK